MSCWFKDFRPCGKLHELKVTNYLPFSKLETFGPYTYYVWASQMAQVVKNPLANAEDVRDPGFNPWVRKIPWRRARQPTPVSCLENPMDRGAWWATVHSVPKNRTCLKWHSMHSHTYWVLRSNRSTRYGPPLQEKLTVTGVRTHEDRALICAPHPPPPLGGWLEDQISKLHDYSSTSHSLVCKCRHST